MAYQIGFILLTHSRPHQMQRLINTLNELFDYPPISCHHDFTQCNLSDQTFTDNVSFVQSYISTQWSDFSLIKATILALEQMYRSQEGPDWFVYLSGADYPVKPPEKIISDLNSQPVDAYIDHILVKKNPENDPWLNLCCRRYYSKKVPNPSRNYKNGRKLNVGINYSILAKMFLPFSETLKCFSGSQWFSGNRKTAAYLLNFFKKDNKVTPHYRTVTFPSESYFQTVLANSSELQLSTEDWRYIDWSEGGKHPKTLTVDDLPNISDSTAHFARKLNLDNHPELYDELDSIIGIKNRSVSNA